MRLLVTLVFAAGLLASCSRQPVFRTVQAADAAPIAAKRSVVILDVRTPAEYAAGHLPGAINIDFLNPSFAGKIESLNKRKKYLVYCRSGSRSTKAVALMKEKEFRKVTNMTDGYSAWKGPSEQ